MKNLILSLVTLFILSGCAAVNTLGDFVNENDLLTSAAARYAVSHYIAEGKTLEDEARRAKQVETRLERVKSYVDGNPTATTGDLMKLAESTINWDELDTVDKMLVMDILALLKKELEQYEAKEDLKESTRVALRGLLDTAISAAKIYLAR